MAEFKLGRIRFVWKGDWTASATYYIDDVVRYGGRTYICVVGHTAAADFNTDLEYIPTKWNQMSDGQSWKNDWTISTLYKLNDVVKYGGLLYICVDSHTSAATSSDGLELDQSKWQVYAEGFDWKDEWTVATRYKKNDLVKYGGYTYVANTGHTSAATAALGLEADQSKWDEFNQGVEYKGNWVTATRYKINDVVKYGAGLWICTTQHTAAALFSTDSANWSQFVEGVEYESTYSGATTYQPGDIVAYGGNQYVAKTINTGSNPVTGTTNWDLYSEGFKFQSDWSGSTSYKIGEVVRVGGYTYLATADSPSYTYTVTATAAGTYRFTTSDTTGMVGGLNGMTIRFSGSVFGNVIDGVRYYVKTVVNGTDFKISTTPNGADFIPTTAVGSMTATVSAEPPNTNYWARLNSGINWRNDWTDDTDYQLGDAVRYGSNTYICIFTHRSEADDGSTVGSQGGGQANSRPDQDITGQYWNVLTVGSETAVLTTRGDLVYYGGAGPTRLPVGIEGQLLRAGEQDPEWVSLGKIDHVYYVAPNGTDLPAPIHGCTLDKPWASIRYACEQILKGPRNPNAKYLLELNRAFIQREVTEWIDYQIANNISPFTSSFDYDEYKCERDTGFIVDALIYDLGHGGNVQSRGAALAYVNALSDSPGTYSRLSIEADEDVAAFNYMLTVVSSVLSNTAPATNYQVLNGDNSTSVVSQYINTDYTAEATAMDDITELVGIITDAIAAGVDTDIPERYSPSNLIHIKSGRYREVLPIIVPEETCLLGDEVRSTNAGPQISLTNPADAKYTLAALSRLETVAGQLIVGTNVTESAGNTATQSQNWPYASSVEVTDLQRLVRTMQHRMDYEIGSMSLATITDPTGYNTSFLSGYKDARELLRNNKKFVQDEVIAFIAANYPSVKYSKTTCKRDVGYIVDAMIYDLTYGGYTQSLNAGLSYFDGASSTLMIDSTELTATLASYARMKTVMQQIIANTTVTVTTGNATEQWKDATNLPNGSNANTFVGANMDIIYNILAGDSTSSAPPTVTITTVSGTDTITTLASHNLQAGDTITPLETSNGLTAGTTYYIKSTPAGNQMTLATSYDGTTITSLVNGSSLSIPATVVDWPVATNGVTTTTALITAWTTLSAAVSTIVTNTTSYITTNYPSLTYNTSKCERDVRIILNSVGYDFMFNSNFQSIKAAYAYLRASASDVFDNNQKTATRAAFSYVKTQAKSNVGGDATAQARIETLMTLIDDIIFGATNEGSNCATGVRAADHAILQLERNRDYIAAELAAYMSATFTTSCSAVDGTTGIITCSDTSWMQRNTAVIFTGAVGVGLSNVATYYVQNVVSPTQFKVASVRNTNTPELLSTGTATFTVSLSNDSANKRRVKDYHRWIDALKYDLKYPGNYKSKMEARLYANTVNGSLEEDMYYVRNATGIRNQTLDGLTGDLLAPNDYGTSRVSAGAYVSLDPGWGPDDFHAWIIGRSPYVQNVATFGYAAVGQKIDGNLHNGGNDSIVSNDFTQLISDGIGAWVLNNGRAELVSVFTYYSHIGYLAESGGRIRGTNGNNSYGDFGSVAEGFDATETPGLGVVDNRNFKATVGTVWTDGSDDIFTFEFDNAGSEYTEATWLITGAGSGADIEQDEFRDDAVFEVRLLDNVDDSTDAPEADGNFGGFGYVSNSNTAQAGTTTQITIAATDPELSAAYVGMKIYLTGGTGVGQYGIIDTYNSGTKVATVIKETTGAAGWDHVVSGYAIQAPDASTTYTVEPRVSFTAPGHTSTAATLPTSGAWGAVVYGNTAASYTGLTGTYTGSGVGATWQVDRTGTKYFVTNINAGTGYSRLQTITIAGTSLGGTSTTNDLTITITAVNSTTGAILNYDYDGYGMGGRYVAMRAGSQTGATSEDGITWDTRVSLMPSAANWSATAAGLFDDGSTNLKVSKFVAVAGTSANTTGAYSEDGITWTASSMVTSATWVGVAFGESRFVAIASDSATVRVSLDGEVWDRTGTLPSTGYTAITYGMGLFVAVKSGSSEAASSTDGVTWTLRSLPSSSNWNSVTWGDGRFVAISATSGTVAAYSLNGTTWTASTLPATATWQKITYGQGVFYAVSTTTQAASSEDGVNWTSRTTSTAASGFSAITFGNRNRYGLFVAVGAGTGTVATYIRTGCTARARAYVASEKIYTIKLLEPGSGYDTAPTITITDPNNIYEAPTQVRIGKGALGVPSFKDRGTGYINASAEVDIGDGYGDYFQYGQYIAVKWLTKFPVAGSNVTFAHLPDQTFKLVNVLTQLGTNPGAYTAFFQVAPDMKNYSSASHTTSLETRIRYSQVRLTGHDFLDIGTGNFDESNYPDGVPENPATQANEVLENNGGRVFYTSTDQDGNFRVGDLFTIEQSTGIATLNADAFNIAGLQELSLGNIALGGGSATISEFSTDPFFTQDSDSVVPTQRAIKAYIASQIGGGGASLNVNSVTAGFIYIAVNQITTTTGAPIQMRAKFDFQGGVTGLPISWNYFLY